MEKEIIELCEKIRTNITCNCCGGKINNYTCIYCGNENEKLKQLLSSLIKLLNDNLYFNSNILFNLYMIKDLQIKEINNILIKNNFVEFLKKRYEDLITKPIVTQQDYEDLINFLDADIPNEVNRAYFINYAMKNLINDSLPVSNNYKLKIIRHFTEYFMKKIHPKVKNPKCIFEKLDKTEDEITLATSSYSNIKIDEEETLYMLDRKLYFKLVSTIVHECTHTYQDYEILSPNDIYYNTYINLLHTKEDIIKRKKQYYYDQNYIKFSKEVEARYCGKLQTLELFKKSGLIDLESTTQVETSINNELFLLQDETRIFNGINTTVDELFDSLNLDSKFLDVYPILKFQYKDIGGKLKMKSKDELLKDYSDYISGKEIQGKPELIAGIYQNLLKKYGVVIQDNFVR